MQDTDHKTYTKNGISTKHHNPINKTPSDMNMQVSPSQSTDILLQSNPIRALFRTLTESSSPLVGSGPTPHTSTVSISNRFLPESCRESNVVQLGRRETVTEVGAHEQAEILKLAAETLTETGWDLLSIHSGIHSFIHWYVHTFLKRRCANYTSL